MYNGHLNIREDLPALSEAEAVGSTSLQDSETVNPQSPLIDIDRGRLRMLRALETQNGIDSAAE